MLPIPPVWAEKETYVDFNLWASTGQTKWRHDASKLDPDNGVPTSELDYQGIDSNIVEVSVWQELNLGHQLQFTIGKGTINDGLLVDDDYVSASGAVNLNTTRTDAHRYSRTHSDIDGGGLLYLEGKFLPEALMLNYRRLQAKLGFGLHYWQEEYIATDVRKVECTKINGCFDESIDLSNTTVITNTAKWRGLGIALDSRLELTQKLRLKLNINYYPLMYLVNEDIHHLRTTGPDALGQNPSIRMHGKGTGFDLFAGFAFQANKAFSAHLGYQLWERRVKSQVITFYGPNGGSSSASLMDFTTRRGGLIGGVTLLF